MNIGVADGLPGNLTLKLPRTECIQLPSEVDMKYHVINEDHKAKHGGRGRVKCSCGENAFSTPEPPSDPFYSGRFVCVRCGMVWSTDNIVQRVSFVEVAS